MKQVRLRSLAYCKLYLGLAALGLRVLPQMRLFDTRGEDIAWDYNLLAPTCKQSSNDVRVTVK
ncbi:cytochrome P450 [Apiospora marii]|uniref:cytochrome P450 n=1 Tax=Apiospora marii TaxID=335849 RepID=UPI003130F60D